MLRNDRGRIALAVMTLLLVVGVCVGPADAGEQIRVMPRAAAAAAPQPPNILLITTDDQRLSDLSWMPKTRELLGGQGLTFRDGLSPHPLCCPARAEILTGQYAQNNGVLSNDGINGGMDALHDSQNTIAPWLQTAGYRTGFVGKFLNGYNWIRHGRQTGWDWWDPTIAGLYNYENFVQYNDGTHQVYRGAYHTDVVSQRTQALVEQWSPGNKPFFIWASYVAPHCKMYGGEDKYCYPPIAAPAYAGTLAGNRNIARASPAFNEANISDKPPSLRNRNPVNVRRFQEVYQARIEALQSVDDAVASAIAALEAAGELDNTLIIFTSDNGYLLGEHRYSGKVYAYEESVRVPFLMRGPGVPAGVTSPRIVTTTDIAPTIVDAAQATPGRVMDGVSFLGASGDDLVDPGHATLVQAGYPHRSAPGQPRWWYRGIRTRRYTYVRWHNGFQELYDRRTDPFQLTNVARNRRYQAVLRILRTETTVLGKCKGPARCNPPIPLPSLR